MASTNLLLAGKYKTRQATNCLIAGIFMPVVCHQNGITAICCGGYGVETGNKRLITANTSSTYDDRRKPAGSKLVEAIAVTTNSGITNLLLEAVMPNIRITVNTDNNTTVQAKNSALTAHIEQIFGDHQIRIQQDKSQNFWFCANDVCVILGYANSRDAIKKNCRKGGVAKRDTPTTSAVQSMTYINEGNLYRLIARSRKKEAEQFESWIFDEVLPTIRKSGEYTPAQGTPISEEPPRITAQQLHELNQRIRRAVTVFHFEEKATQRVCNNIRFMLNIGNVADIHPDDYNLGHGLPYTSVLRRQYSAEMDLKLPRNPDWQQAVKTLEAKQLENRGGQH